MKRFSEQLHKKSQTVKLKASERSDLRERLVSYMEYHPLPAEIKNKKTKKTPKGIYTEPYKVISIPFKTLFKYSSAVAAFVLLVVPFVAEKSVPGDSLYAIKVQFNEEIIGTLTFDAYQKVEWETERVNRRIAEAKLLASEGKLTEEVEVEVANAVREHTANAQREIEALRAEDEDAAKIASIALDTTLEVQSDSLKGEEVERIAVEGGSETEVSLPKNLIADAIDQSRVTVEDREATSTLPAYDKMMARVEFNTTRIYESLETLKDKVSEEDLAEVTRRAEDIDRAIVEAVALKESDEEAAKQGLIGVLQSSQKLIVLMTDLRVVQESKLDTLLPVVLTKEEKELNKASMLSEIEDKTLRLDNLLSVAEEKGLLEKVNLARIDLDEKVSQLSTTTISYEDYVNVANEVVVVLDELLDMLASDEKASVEIVTTEDVPDEMSTSTATTTDSLKESTEPEVETASSTEQAGELEEDVVDNSL